MPELCEDSSVEINKNTCDNAINENVQHAECTYKLTHIKFDFYNKDADVVVQVYIKEIKDNSLAVTFKENELTLRFKTRSNEFLKLQVDSSAETLFEWHVKLRHRINSSESKYKTSKEKVTLTLRKKEGGKWNSLHSLCDEEKTSNRDLKSVMVNGRQGVVNRSCPKSSGSLTSTTEISCKINDKQNNNVFKSISNNTTSFNTGSDDYNDGNKVQEKSLNDGVNQEDNVHRKDPSSNHYGDNDLKREDQLGGKLLNNCSINNDQSSNANNCIYRDCSSSNDDSEKNSNDHSTTSHNKDLTNHGSTVDDNSFEKCNKSAVEVTTPATVKPTPQAGTRFSIWQDDECSDSQEKSGAQSTATSYCDSVKASKDRTSDDFILSYDEKIDICRPGSTGLINLRNMCYINSIVQCLSAVRGLRTYLLNKGYYSDINRKTEHGFGGDLVTCFGLLLKTLWSGKERCSSAKKLKAVLGRKHTGFDHVGQGDAQEFLSFLLDGLHEDLKNDKKIFIEQKNHGECQTNIVEKGLKYWQKFINGNQSIIIDLFHGQTVSEVQCKDCKKVSVQFAPWMQLNLAIPNEPKYLSIYVFFLDPASKPLQVKLKVVDGAYCAEILKQLSQLVDVPANQLVLLSPSYNRIAHIFDETEELSYCQIKEYLIACQLVKEENNVEEDEYKDLIEKCNGNLKIEEECPLSKVDEVQNNRILRISVIQRSTHRVIRKCNSCSSGKSALKHCSKCFRVAYCGSACQAKHWKTHRSSCNFLPDVIGFPFIISIPASQATLSELEKKALQYSSFSVAPKEGELEKGPCRLRLLKNISDFNSKGEALTQKGTRPVVSDDVCIALDWESAVADQKVLSKQLDCDDHESVKTKLPTEDKTSSLEECLNLYWKPEIIRKETGWRCDYCKDVCSAGRKVRVFRHPKNMIIHIKRFSYEGNGRKIKKDVSFPLRGLNMSPYSYPESLTGKAVYDLHAVCSHLGSMDFGHYVTYAKPYSPQELHTLNWANTDGWLCYNDNKVGCVTERQVEKAEAYILFYRRRDERTINFNKPTKMSSNSTLDAAVIKEASEVHHINEEDTCLRTVNQTHTASQSKDDELLFQDNDRKKDDSTSCNNIPHSQIDDVSLEDQLD